MLLDIIQLIGYGIFVVVGAVLMLLPMIAVGMLILFLIGA